MADFTAYTPLTAEETNITQLDLKSGPHTFTFNKSKQVLTVKNDEAVQLTLNLLGAGVSEFECSGYGTVDVSGGKDFTIEAGETKTFTMSYISEYLGDDGNTVTLTVTGSTDSDLAFAWLAEY